MTRLIATRVAWRGSCDKMSTSSEAGKCKEIRLAVRAVAGLAEDLGAVVQREQPTCCRIAAQLWQWAVSQLRTAER